MHLVTAPWELNLRNMETLLLKEATLLQDGEYGIIGELLRQQARAVTPKVPPVVDVLLTLYRRQKRLGKNSLSGLSNNTVKVLRQRALFSNQYRPDFPSWVFPHVAALHEARTAQFNNCKNSAEYQQTRSLPDTLRFLQRWHTKVGGATSPVLHKNGVVWPAWWDDDAKDYICVIGVEYEGDCVLALSYQSTIGGLF